MQFVTSSQATQDGNYNTTGTVTDELTDTTIFVAYKIKISPKTMGQTHWAPSEEIETL